MHNFEFPLIFINNKYFAKEGWSAQILGACGLWLYALMTWVTLKLKCTLFAVFFLEDLHGLRGLINNCLLWETWNSCTIL